MARETVYQQSNPETAQTESIPTEQDHSLRPKLMDEMVGQQDVIERLRIAIKRHSRGVNPWDTFYLMDPRGLAKPHLLL